MRMFSYKLFLFEISWWFSRWLMQTFFCWLFMEE